MIKNACCFRFATKVSSFRRCRMSNPLFCHTELSILLGCAIKKLGRLIGFQKLSILWGSAQSRMENMKTLICPLGSRIQSTEFFLSYILECLVLVETSKWNCPSIFQAMVFGFWSYLSMCRVSRRARLAIGVISLSSPIDSLHLLTHSKLVVVSSSSQYMADLRGTVSYCSSVRQPYISLAVISFLPAILVHVLQ